MGICCSKPDVLHEDQQQEVNSRRNKREAPTKQFHKPRWKSTEPLTPAKLEAMRSEFWDTAPHYGGDKVIWDALKAVCQADMETARLLIDAAGIIVARPDMTVLYDERGVKYELPKYVLIDPTNMVTQPDPGQQQQQQQVAEPPPPPIG